MEGENVIKHGTNILELALLFERFRKNFVLLRLVL